MPADSYNNWKCSCIWHNYTSHNTISISRQKNREKIQFVPKMAKTIRCTLLQLLFFLATSPLPSSFLLLSSLSSIPSLPLLYFFHLSPSLFPQFLSLFSSQSNPILFPSSRLLPSPSQQEHKAPNNENTPANVKLEHGTSGLLHRYECRL